MLIIFLFFFCRSTPTLSWSLRSWAAWSGAYITKRAVSGWTSCRLYRWVEHRCHNHGLSPFWTPKPLKSTPQDTQNLLCGITKNLNLKLIIEFFHLLKISMTLFNSIMPYFGEFIHVYGWNMSILWSPLKIWTPKNSTTANFRHPVSKSWLRHWSQPWPSYTWWHDLLLSNLYPVITIAVTYISVILTQLWLFSWPTSMWSWPSYALCHNNFCDLDPPSHTCSTKKHQMSISDVNFGKSLSSPPLQAWSLALTILSQLLHAYNTLLQLTSDLWHFWK